MFSMQLTGNLDEMSSMINRITQELNDAEARSRACQVELDAFADKKRIIAGTYFNKVLSDSDFDDALERLADEREKVACSKFDADERITELKARSLKLSNLRSTRVKAQALERNLKVASDDYLRLLDVYATATAAHNSALEQIPAAERTDYDPKLEGARPMLTDLIHAAVAIIREPSATQPTAAHSNQQKAPDTHECTFATESRFCTHLTCWKITDQK